MNPEFKTVEVVAASIAVFERYGFHKKRNPQGEKPSSARLYEYFTQPDRSDIRITDEHREKAEDVIMYFKGLTFKAIERKLSDFEANVLKAVSQNTVPASSSDGSPVNLGIMASLPKVYTAKIKQEDWQAREAELAATSEFIGTPFRMIEFPMVVENIRPLKDQFGEKILVCGSTLEGNIVKFFVDNRFEKCFNVGEAVNFRGAVKSHVESKYHGGKETMFNRIDTQRLLEQYEEKMAQKDPELT